MKLRFAKFDPTGNTTILVRTPVPREEQPRVAEALMAHNSLCAEQVGFLEAPTLPGACARLQMAGGEFCGNASMSLAAQLALDENLPCGAEREYPLEVSGAGGIVPCRVARSGESAFTGAVGMPLPEEITEMALPSGRRVPLIRFQGIAHMLVAEDALFPAEAEAIIPGLCDALDADALGLLLMCPEPLRMRPLIYVRSIDTAVWESGCGSGSAALGAYAALRAQRDVFLKIAQPGGVIGVRAIWEHDRVGAIEIQGNVRLAADGEAFID